MAARVLWLCLITVRWLARGVATGQDADIIGIEADFTHWKGYNFARQRDPNLSFNPATGYNANPTTAGRPDPAHGRIHAFNGSNRTAAPTTRRSRAPSLAAIGTTGSPLSATR